MSINLKSDPIQKSFIQYLLPALSGMVIKSTFIMGNAWFVGKGVGAEGLGAISLTIPAFSLFTAIAMMIGIGGAALMSIEYGKVTSALDKPCLISRYWLPLSLRP
ncbi:multidrug efflux pump VmrA [Vibrio thalassae]|uniref:Multidrug efflux pump VmrA n=1 Tax=Vibrio thalassae TaxID=1243014 RepID=A0A240ELH7_9VIBR|nr:multidrug efflux pump VmrA [Vibrio thalassae]